MRHRLTLLLAAIAATVPPACAAEPAKRAESARFDLMADTAVQAIDDGQSIDGGGSIARMNWVPEADRSRGYTVNFPIGHRGWKPAAFRFTPTRSGAVTITLMGPWEEAEKGVLYRQEVLWDDFRVEGAALANGGFEPTRSRRTARTWQGQGVVSSQTRDVPAVDGTHYARTWHNQPLSSTMAVTGGRPVTIRLSARTV